MKRCSKCRAEKPYEDFYVRSSSPDGRRPTCKKCDVAGAMAWNAANKERAKKAEAKWREKNRAYLRTSARALYIKNKDAYKAKARAWAKNNPDKMRAAARRRKIREAAAQGHASTEAMQSRAAMWGFRCAYCQGPFDDFDHTIPLSRGGSNWPANIRPICATCNKSKMSKTPAEWAEHLAFEADVFLGRFRTRSKGA